MPLTNEINLLAILCLPQCTEEESKRAVYLSKNIKPDKFMRLAKWHRVIPSIYGNIKKLFPDMLSETDMDDLKDRYTKNCNQCQQQMIAISEISDRLKKAGINFRFLKGIPLAIKYYGTPFSRNARDIDILVKQNEIASALTIFIELGYQTNFETLSERQKNIYLSCHKDITLVSDVGVVVELHCRLSEYSVCFSNELTGRFLNDKTDRYEIYEFIYLCWHGAHSLFHRLKWLIDIEIYIRNKKWNSDEWKLIMGLARQYGVDQFVLFSVLLADRIFLHNYNNNLTVKQNINISHYTSIASNYLSNPKKSQSFKGKLCTYLSEIRLLTSYLDKIVVLKHKLKPTLADIVLLPDLPKLLYFLYPLLRPFRFVYSHYFIGDKKFKKHLYEVKPKI